MTQSEMRRIIDLLAGPAQAPAGAASRPGGPVRLDEAGAGPGRILRHMRHGEPFFAISAMRSYVSHPANMRRAERLRADLAALPVTCIPIEGEYQEAGTDAPSAELSLFVMAQPPGGEALPDRAGGEPEQAMAAEDLRLVGTRLMRRYDQDSIVYGDGERVWLLTREGGAHDLGGVLTFSLKAIEDTGHFSKIKGRKFAFTDPKTAPKGVAYGSARRRETG